VVVALAFVVGAGCLLGLVAFRMVGSDNGWPTTVTRTADGWRLGSPDGLSQDGVALSDRCLTWLNGGCLELLDLRSGRVTVLEQPPSDGTGGFAAVVSDRFAVWMSNDGTGDSTGVQVYDVVTGRRFLVRGANPGDIALDGSTLFWDQSMPTPSDPDWTVISSRDLVSGRSARVASGDVLLEQAGGGLVMWTQVHGKGNDDPFTVVADLATGRLWRLALCPKGWQEWGCYLSGRVVVWQVERDPTGSRLGTSLIEALDLDSDARRRVAEGKAPDMLVAGGGRIFWSCGSRSYVQAATGGAVHALPGLRINEGPPALSADMVAGGVGDAAGGSAAIDVVRLAP